MAKKPTEGQQTLRTIIAATNEAEVNAILVRIAEVVWGQSSPAAMLALSAALARVAHQMMGPPSAGNQEAVARAVAAVWEDASAQEAAGHA